MNCKISDKKMLSDNICSMVLECKEIADRAKAGQFLHILCGGNSYLRRPISICEIVDKENVRIVFQIKGEGTKSLAEKNTGDFVDVLGPLGNGFDIDNNFDNIIIVGGGIGTFPLLELSKKFGKSASVLLGFRSEKDVLLEAEFAKYTDKIFLATEDGSCGYKGYVTDLLRNILRSNKVDIIYICGPMPMMKAAAEVAAEFGVEAQVSLEERMGCGIGACVTCTCTVGGERKRVCKDGPVFVASEVEWNG